MSVHGYTLAASSASAAGTSPATSSSHQPPSKQLKAVEAASTDDSVKALGDSTDEDLRPSVVEAVPNVTEENEGSGEAPHDADVFVPKSDRSTTLETSVPLETSVTDVHGAASVSALQRGGGVSSRSCGLSPPLTVIDNEEQASGSVGAQPATPRKPVKNDDDMNHVEDVKKEQKIEGDVMKEKVEGRGAGTVLTGWTPGEGAGEGCYPNPNPKPGGNLVGTDLGDVKKEETSTSSSTEMVGPPPVAANTDPLLQSSGSSAVCSSSVPMRSRSDPMGLCTIFKNPKNQQHPNNKNNSTNSYGKATPPRFTGADSHGRPARPAGRAGAWRRSSARWCGRLAVAELPEPGAATSASGRGGIRRAGIFGARGSWGGRGGRGGWWGGKYGT